MSIQERRCEAEGNCGKEATAGDRWIAGISMIAGAAVGATVMYFCDSHRGKARRAELQQKAGGVARQAGHEVAIKAEDLLNRAKGLVAKADAAFERSEKLIDDDVVAERVRSHMGHLTEHARDIQTEVVGGVVALHGAVSPDKHRQMIDEILKIPGVKGVRDRLAPAGSGRKVPAAS
ncbi:MAG: BON domain-containing protein [Acidobacteriia bacterium]|nr:BON domain-containing protein [Terriglobia bacterium]